MTCLDLSRAFDSLNHELLLKKLKKLQLTSSFYKLIETYLVDRLQFVHLNNFLSDQQIVESGTVQGGVISGTLFNFYTNSIKFLKLNSSCFLYCDDISLVTSTKLAEDIKLELEEDLETLSEWLQFHFLFPNPCKTKYILFHNKKRHEDFILRALNIKFNNMQIERVESLRLLGLFIDETLNFSKHIAHINSQLVPFMFALKRIRHFISEKTAIVLYFAYIQSKLSFMNVIWQAAPKYLLESLEILQRKSLRIVLRKDWFCHKNELYSSKIINVSNLCKLASCVLVFKMVNATAKNNNTFRTVNQLHGFNTRTNDCLVVAHCQLHLGMQNFYVHALNVFNSLPPHIRRLRSLGTFKDKCKVYFATDNSCNE